MINHEIQMILEGSNKTLQLSPRTEFTRNIDPIRMDYLIQLLFQAFNKRVSREEIYSIILLINYIESQMLGRIAGDIEDLIIHYFIKKFAIEELHQSFQSSAILEIGVLFGGTLIITQILLEIMKLDNIQNIGIDPLEGYYFKDTQNKLDPCVQIEVNLENIQHNLHTFGLNDNNVLCICKYSNDPNALEAVKDKQVLCLFIDGGHRYEDIKNDWEKYSALVVDNGYVLIDNYNDDYWTEVADYINEEVLLKVEDWSTKLMFSRSILLKKNNKNENNRFYYNQSLDIMRKIQNINKRLEIFKRQLDNKEKYASKLQGKVNSINESIIQKDQQIKEMQHNIKELEHKLKDCNEHWRKQKKENNLRIQELQETLQGKQDLIKKLQNDMTIKDTLLTEIKQTTSWKLGHSIIRLMVKLFGWIPFIKKRL